MAKAKEWWESKSLWGALLILLSVISELAGSKELSRTLAGLGLSLGIVGLRFAKTKLK